MIGISWSHPAPSPTPLSLPLPGPRWHPRPQDGTGITMVDSLSGRHHLTWKLVSATAKSLICYSRSVQVGNQRQTVATLRCAGRWGRAPVMWPPVCLYSVRSLILLWKLFPSIISPQIIKINHQYWSKISINYLNICRHYSKICGHYLKIRGHFLVFSGHYLALFDIIWHYLKFFPNFLSYYFTHLSNFFAICKY